MTVLQKNDLHVYDFMKASLLIKGGESSSQFRWFTTAKFEQ